MTDLKSIDLRSDEDYYPNLNGESCMGSGFSLLDGEKYFNIYFIKKTNKKYYIIGKLWNDVTKVDFLSLTENIKKLNLQIEEEKIKNQISEINKSPKPLKYQNKNTIEFKEREDVKKSTLIEAINHSNLYYSLMIKKYNDFINDKTNYNYYNWGSEKLNKQQFIRKCTTEKEKNETYKNLNNAAKLNLEKYFK
ncbi:hypothetical protein [Flavobacterium sp. N502540]|uniref:hypothetical protein n=1 Tax=Flavobacterium sp. N502540 TaxID=2986838 RepID=UPI00222536DB|nr:hypothetical protein [Flavobacterium sp. N502540]